MCICRNILKHPHMNMYMYINKYKYIYIYIWQRLFYAVLFSGRARNRLYICTLFLLILLCCLCWAFWSCGVSVLISAVYTEIGWLLQKCPLSDEVLLYMCVLWVGSSAVNWLVCGSLTTFFDFSPVNTWTSASFFTVTSFAGNFLYFTCYSIG